MFCIGSFGSYQSSLVSVDLGLLVKVSFLTDSMIQQLEITSKHHNVAQVTDESHLYNDVAVMHMV